MGDAVGYVLVCRDGYLLTQLREDIPTILYPGYWVLPGGSVEGDESPAEATAREIHEETDLVIAPDKLKLLCQYLRESDGVQAHVFIYLLADNEEPIFMGEGQCFLFVSPDHLVTMELGFEQNRYILPHLLRFLELQPG